jgi:hypothetical protein
MAFKKTVSPDKDTGWGVIFRLNSLFSEVEDLAPTGKYDDWNIKLDRIWSNLLYRNPMEIKKDNNGKILSIDLRGDDVEEKTFLDNQILKAKGEMSVARKKVPEGDDYTRDREWVKGKKKLYKALLIKEIWLRKFMNGLGLYLKEVEYNPAGAMWNK